MDKLELFYPAKPYNVTQAFGIKNGTYKENGLKFTHHNGIDFRVDTDGIVRAMCDGVVYEVGENDKAGKYARYKTFVDGAPGAVAFMYMHGHEILVEKGQEVKVGDPIMVADNTGLSTGPHTHISAYYVNSNNIKLPIGSESTDWCLDFSRYYNGYYADDAQSVFHIIRSIIKLLQQSIAIRSKSIHT